MESVRNCEKHKRACEAFCFQCHKIEKPMCPICLCEHNAEVHAVKSAHITQVIKQQMDAIRECLAQTPEKQQKIKELTEQAAAIKKEKDDVLGHMDDKLKLLEAYCKEQRVKTEESDKTLIQFCDDILGQMKGWEEKLRTREAVPERLAPKLDELMANQKYWEAYDESSNALQKEVQLNEQEVVQIFQKCDVARADFKKRLVEVEAVDVNGGSSPLREQNEKLTQELAALRGTSHCVPLRLDGHPEPTAHRGTDHYRGREN
jgi:hypothetical protein